MTLQSILYLEILRDLEQKDAQRIAAAIQKRLTLTVMEPISDERKTQ